MGGCGEGLSSTTPGLPGRSSGPWWRAGGARAGRHGAARGRVRPGWGPGGALFGQRLRPRGGGAGAAQVKEPAPGQRAEGDGGAGGRWKAASGDLWPSFHPV